MKQWKNLKGRELYVSEEVAAALPEIMSGILRAAISDADNLGWSAYDLYHLGYYKGCGEKTHYPHRISLPGALMVSRIAMPHEGVFGPEDLTGGGAKKFECAVDACGGIYEGVFAYAYGRILSLAEDKALRFDELEERGFAAMNAEQAAIAGKWDDENADCRYYGWRDYRRVKERAEAICADLESVGL